MAWAVAGEKHRRGQGHRQGHGMDKGTGIALSGGRGEATRSYCKHHHDVTIRDIQTALNSTQFKATVMKLHVHSAVLPVQPVQESAHGGVVAPKRRDERRPEGNLVPLAFLDHPEPPVPAFLYNRRFVNQWRRCVAEVEIESPSCLYTASHANRYISRANES